MSKERELLFVTTNKHKVSEANAVLKEYGYRVRQVKYNYDEASEDSIQQIAKKGALACSRKLKKTVIVEDTGIFFKAYNDFPGTLPKFIFKTIGYEGIFRLLRGKKREAYFMSVIGFCRHGGKANVFEGKLPGRITSKVKMPKDDVLPYERIFVPKGYSKTMVELGFAKKNEISHRAKAFHKLGKFLKKEDKK